MKPRHGNEKAGFLSVVLISVAAFLSDVLKYVY